MLRRTSRLLNATIGGTMLHGRRAYVSVLVLVYRLAYHGEVVAKRHGRSCFLAKAGAFAYRDIIGPDPLAPGSFDIGGAVCVPQVLTGVQPLYSEWQVRHCPVRSFAAGFSH